MPIQIIQNSFENSFGVVTNQYTSNAGDEIVASFRIRSAIRITSVSNPLSLDVSLNSVTSPSISWLDEGFRIGDSCYFRILSAGGSLVNSWFSTIVYVDDTTCDFTAMPDWYDQGVGEIIEIRSCVSGTDNNYRSRDNFDIFINHSISGQQGQVSSLIDGESSRCVFNNVASMNAGDTRIGVKVNNQSGQFFKEAVVQRIANSSDGWYVYDLELTFVNSGMYDASWFATGSYLKFFLKVLWQSISNDQYSPAIVTYDENANTGWFNEANNFSIADSTLVQGTQEVDYLVPTSHVVKVDGVTTDIGIGACYVSVNEAYYKNKVYNQYPITMLLPTSDITAGPFSSFLNVDNAGYDIVIDNISVVGTETTIEFTFTPNSEFYDFMTNVDDGDRLFYIWIKCGNINHLVFADQLKVDPPVGGSLTMFNDYGFLDHSENVTSIDDSLTGFEANTEDDVAYYGTFLLNKNEKYQSFNVKVEAFNSVTLEDFTLQETTFSFDGVQISNDGVYLLDQTLNVNSILPSTSNKINSAFYLFPDIDTIDKYGVAIYYPFILNWRYWLAQNNASVDFYPSQNRNWVQYSSPLDWQLRVELTLTQNNLGYTHSNVIIDKDYDSEKNIDQSIELYVDSTNQNVGVVTQGELMRVVATHTINNGQVWDQTDVWGMITIEPKESSPRWLLSTIVPYDNNLNNPLYPLSGLLIDITYPALNVARMECFFDPSRINLENGCKFTTKIKGCATDPPISVEKTTTDGANKTTTDGDVKTIAS
jgi:hypothetical protein